MSKSRPGPRASVAFSSPAPVARGRTFAEATEPATPLPTGPGRAWTRFWFTPADPVALHVVRLAAGLVFLAWLLPLAGHADALFGLDGWFDRQAYREASRIPGGPPQPITWSLLYLCGTHAGVLTAVAWSAVGVLVLFTLGLWTRLTAVLTWLIVASFTASPALSGDADSLLLVLALYLMIGYGLLGLTEWDRSWAARLLGAADTFLFGRRFPRADAWDRRSVAANVALRLLQVHLAIIMVVSGLHKLQFGDWWSGMALWYPLHPIMEMSAQTVDTPEQVRTSLEWLGLAGYAVLAWQLAFPVFAWRPRWRPLLLGGAFVGALGCAFLYRMPVFGPALFVGCLSYVSAAEWYRLFARLGSIPGLQRIVPSLSAAAEPLVPQGAR